MTEEKFEHFFDIKIPAFERLTPEAAPCTYKCNEDGGIAPLAIVNLFIGTNNSGKSRLLRKLASTEKYERKLLIRDFQQQLRMAKDYFNHLPVDLLKFPKAFGEDILTGAREKIEQIEKLNHRYYEDAGQFLKSYYSICAELGQIFNEAANRHSISSSRAVEAINTIVEHNKNLKHNTSNFRPPLNVIFQKRIYIPILRGLRQLSGAGAFYRDRTAGDYQIPISNIFTGESIYDDLKRKILGKPDKQKLVHTFENFLSDRFFSHAPVKLTPIEPESGEDKLIEVKIGTAPQFPIHDLGDGMQSLLICLYPIFMAPPSERHLFFIEEPDICMHPSLQRAFLEALITGDHRRHQYFITTHSNHFIDFTLDYSDISVFHFRKANEEKSEFIITSARSGSRDILRDLGVHPSSVLLANATIWVEGITDRLYLRTFMKKYCDGLKVINEKLFDKYSSYREDCHYSFVEYQGSNLVHWTFDPTDENIKKIKVNFLCGPAIVVADGDIVTKGSRKETYTKELGENFVILDVKEIENLLPEEAVRVVVAEKLKGKDVDISSITYTGYYNIRLSGEKLIGLGEYLDTTLKVSSFSGDSGTVKNKTGFCQDIISYLDTHSDWKLPKEAEALVIKIFRHIASQNP